jgi:hypothetical protein
MSIQACMFRIGLISICLASAWAQQPAVYESWIRTSQDKNLTEIHVPPIYDFFPYNAGIVYDSSNQLHTIAVRDGEVLLVELNWR